MIYTSVPGTHHLTSSLALNTNRLCGVVCRFNICLMLATQLTGFGLAGICRRFLVWPASMIWPQNLVVCTLLNTLHAEDDENGQGMTRYRFFLWVMFAAFAYQFLPGLLFTALSTFSWICWFSPREFLFSPSVPPVFGSRLLMKRVGL